MFPAQKACAAKWVKITKGSPHLPPAPGPGHVDPTEKLGTQHVSKLLAKLLSCGSKGEPLFRVCPIGLQLNFHYDKYVGAMNLTPASLTLR